MWSFSFIMILRSVITKTRDESQTSHRRLQTITKESQKSHRQATDKPRVTTDESKTTSDESQTYMKWVTDVSFVYETLE